jgi:cytoskeletal protein CcmA (bactofilin family)
MLFRQKGTIIAEGLKIIGSVSAEGLVEVNGYIEGDLHCTYLIVSPRASIHGGIEAERVVVNGRVEGAIRGGEVVLKSHAHVVGDIEHDSLLIEKGAHFDGRSVHSPETSVPFERPAPEEIKERWAKRAAQNGRDRAAAPAE